ncbi:MAG: acetyl-CoA carboxylase biotin carboxyl carrier protein [candidate division KSB1 bacterium]|nr:acetyl-CoA carboxylase biotin carboxyl carrier protein [candidate division KSB1 bacterium]MDZ7294141.1 acetyl-CoA carboxylase biotin carboxyl carrier protein [candidate division KSB1 bacterium]MDZ7337317.1 acetyl-CoA carboxylase biotin carboxyl carrier protein [candidate division KSB1 bacterium]MDZ7377844.1 acetyl-CoA carboxylase biotin carboxyl carrier protein [candidate division KSB1 bacterium]MDZ7386585.1 acetyl-CoA carboxylase biotin carboxyl carrier protein [candidate division KSB1 bact
MKEAKLRKLIKLVEESDIEELEISSWGKSVRIRKTVLDHRPSPAVPARPETTVVVESPLPPAQAPAALPTQEAAPQPVTPPAQDIIEIKSPMVGTFYRRPSPEAEPYVEVGDIISPGKVLCIIEAMKLMNEIESEVSGKILKILVENAQPVEYGQPLFQVQLL